MRLLRRFFRKLLNGGRDVFIPSSHRSCGHMAIITGGKPSNHLLLIRCSNTLLGNNKTRLSDMFHYYSLCKYDLHYLCGLYFRSLQRSSMVAST